jgi:hypothetical protein
MSSAGRSRGLFAACLLTVALGSSAAGAQTTHPLDGNMRFQIGKGLPTPITFQPRPDGAIEAVDGAIVSMATANGPITLKPSQLTNPGTPRVIAPFFGGGNLFQVNTSIAIQFPRPGGTAVFAPNGRTGADLVTFCPGQVVTPAGNPACGGPDEGTINGLMRYTRTAGQIGGPAQAARQGAANIALRASSGAPCAYDEGANPACRAIFALATPAATGAQGGAFGFFFQTSPGAPSPGLFHVTAGPLGSILGITPTGLDAGFPNPVTSYGGPWTAGKLTLSVTANLGASTEVVVLSGMDTRDPATGQGSVSLVSGSVSFRSLSSQNANRGWLNLIIEPPFGVVPAMTTPGLAATIGLIALVGTYFLRKRF